MEYVLLAAQILQHLQIQHLHPVNLVTLLALPVQQQLPVFLVLMGICYLEHHAVPHVLQDFSSQQLQVIAKLALLDVWLVRMRFFAKNVKQETT